MTPKRIPTETIVSSVEAVLSRQRELSEPTKDNIRSRIASTIQSASLTDNNLTKDERQALKRLRNDNDILILLADKGRVTVVMDKTDCHDKMDELVNDKQTYEVLKRDPTPALQRKLNSKLLQLKKAGLLLEAWVRIPLLANVVFFSPFSGSKTKNTAHRWLSWLSTGLSRGRS